LLNQAYDEAWVHRQIPKGGNQTASEEYVEAQDDDPMALVEAYRRERKGQPQFRKNLLRIYDGKCAISGWGPECVLEAAHIDYHAETGINKSDNGLLLRADLHYLFDAGLLKINPDDFTVSIDISLKRSEYWQYHGMPIRTRIDGSYPAREYLKKRLS